MRRGEIDRRPERLAGVLLLAMTLINAATVVHLTPMLRNGYQDFTIFYGAGVMIRSGPPGHFYDLAVQYQVQKQFAPNVLIRQAALPYNHPPFEALLFVPFTYLGYLPAYLLWTLLNVIMVVLSLRMLRRTFPEVRALSLPFMVLAAAGFVPLMIALIQGQDSVLQLFLFAICLTSLEEKNDIAAGAALAVGLVKFHLALPLMLILAVRRPRLLFGFAPVAALLAVISGMVVGWRGLVDYLPYLLRLEETGAGGAISAAGMPNLRGLITDLLGGHASVAFSMWVTAAISIALMGIAVWVVRRRDSPIRFVFAVASVASVMVSYHAIAHDLAWLLLVVLLLFSAPGRATRGEMQPDTILLTALYTILLASSPWPWLGPLWCAPVLVWIYRKYGGGYAAGAAASA